MAHRAITNAQCGFATRESTNLVDQNWSLGRDDAGEADYDVANHRMVGNIPQAFSHIALVNAAFYLEEGRNVRRRANRSPRKGSKPTGRRPDRAKRRKA